MTLLEYRTKHNLAQVVIAKLIGRSSGAVGHWETGKRIPRLETAMEVMRVTGGAVTPNDFYGVVKQ